MRLLGHDGDRAQFDPFQFPRGCWLEISSVIGGRVVSILADAPPTPLPRRDERDRLRSRVCDAYIRALEGREGRLHATKTVLQLTEGMCSWMEAVESWTSASALTLAWTGAVRIEARPTFTISAWRTVHATGPITVEVTSDGSPAMRTAVPTAHTLYPTVRAVVDAFRQVTGIDMLKHELQNETGDDGFLLGYLSTLGRKRHIHVTPRRPCCMCNSYVDGTCSDAQYVQLLRMYSDAQCLQFVLHSRWHVHILCIDCARSVRGAETAVRMWGVEFRLFSAGLPAIEVRSPIKVEHTDAEPVKEYYAQCCAVPAESMSIWQHMAYVACLAEDLFLRVVGAGQPGRLRLKLTSALLGRLSEAIIRRILAHLKSAILPPSRAQLERGV